MSCSAVTWDSLVFAQMYSCVLHRHCHLLGGAERTCESIYTKFNFIILCCHILRTHALGVCEYLQSVDIQSEIIFNSQPMALAIALVSRQVAQTWLRVHIPLRGCETLKQWI